MIEPEIVNDINNYNYNNNSKTHHNKFKFKLYKMNGFKAILLLITIFYILIKIGWNILISLFDPILIILIIITIIVWKFF